MVCLQKSNSRRMGRTILVKNIIFIVLSALVFSGCASSTSDFSTLPVGDASRGALLYAEMINGAPSCASCHSLSDERLVGPSFMEYSSVADSRVEGQSAEEYSYNSIVRSATHLVDGYSNLMYSEYGTKLAEQDLADLIAFLLTQ